MRGLRAACVAVLLVVALPAEAGRPLDTDDAAIIPRYGCQIETFVARAGSAGSPPTAEAGFAPSCNPLGNAEWLVGVMRSDSGDVGAGAIGTVQYKGLLRAIRDGSPGGAYVVAYSDDLSRRGDRSANRVAYAAAIASAMVTKDLQIDLNVGAQRQYDVAEDRRRTFLAWRIAGEWAISQRWMLVAEQTRTVGSDHLIRVGATFAVVPALTLDASIARRCQPACDTTLVMAGLTWVGEVLPHGGR